MSAASWYITANLTFTYSKPVLHFAAAACSTPEHIVFLLKVKANVAAQTSRGQVVALYIKRQSLSFFVDTNRRLSTGPSCSELLRSRSASSMPVRTLRRAI